MCNIGKEKYTKLKEMLLILNTIWYAMHHEHKNIIYSLPTIGDDLLWCKMKKEFKV